MIVFLTLIYVAFLFVLIKLRIVPNRGTTWGTTIIWVVGLFLLLFVPMQWGAPAGKARVMTRAVQIIPEVSGQVVSVDIQPNVALKQGDLLFRIDPEPFQIAVDLAQASLVQTQAQARQDQDDLDAALAQFAQAQATRDLAQSRYDDDEKLVQSGTISENRLEQRQTDLLAAQGALDQADAQVSRARNQLGAVTDSGIVATVAQAQAQLDRAVWELEQTEIRAPSDGFVTSLTLVAGQRVTSLPLAPAMVFVDTTEAGLVANIQQIYLRHLRAGQPVEIAIKTRPGEILTGTVETVVDIASQGQAVFSGQVLTLGEIVAEPFAIRIAMDDPSVLQDLRPGTVGTIAIYTDSVQTTHVIRKVMIRMESIMNYVIPGL